MNSCRKILNVIPLFLFVFFAASGVRAQSTTPDFKNNPTLYVVSYAHLDTQWRWDYVQTIDEYLPATMHDNFALFEKYPLQRLNNAWTLVLGGQPQRKEKIMEYESLRPGCIKRAPVAWFASHRHTAEGKNEAYAYSYLHMYKLQLPAGAAALTLPDNDKIRILAVTVSDEGASALPAQPLYDTLGNASE